jgi:hypothetical protein
MKIAQAIVTVLVATVATAQNAPPFQNCATGVTGLDVTSYTYAPYPVCPGKDVCTTIVGALKEPIVQGATLTITGRFAGNVVYSDTLDFCAALAASGTPCPVAASASITLKGCVAIKSDAVPNVSHVGGRKERRH